MQNFKEQIIKIAGDLLNLEINTIVKPGIDGVKMASPRHALLDEESLDAWGIAVDMQGFVYVCEGTRNRIQKLTSDGQIVDTWKSWGTGDGEFFRPFDIAVDTNGFVCVHELYSSRMQKFTPEGQFVETAPIHGQLKEIDSNNFFYYIDDTVYEGLIRKVSSDGEIVAQWNRTGSGYMVLLGPCDVTVDMNGFVYVADQGYYDSVWTCLGLSHPPHPEIYS